MENPVILFVDDEFGKNKPSEIDTIKSIKAVANALGYDAENVIEHMRFFSEVQSRGGALDYIKTHSANEVIAQAFIDDQFYVPELARSVSYSKELMLALFAEADKHKHTMPVVISLSEGKDARPSLQIGRLALLELHQKSPEAIRALLNDTVTDEMPWYKANEIKTVQALKATYETLQPKKTAIEMAGLGNQSEPRRPQDTSPKPREGLGI